MGGRQLKKRKYWQSCRLLWRSTRSLGLDLGTVLIDGYYAAKEIVRYLVGIGHTRLGHISGPADKTSSAADRLQGFHDILEESNLELVGHSALNITWSLAHWQQENGLLPSNDQQPSSAHAMKFCWFQLAL